MTENQKTIIETSILEFMLKKYGKLLINKDDLKELTQEINSNLTDLKRIETITLKEVIDGK